MKQLSLVVFICFLIVVILMSAVQLLYSVAHVKTNAELFACKSPIIEIHAK
jgi:hypothetical protein